MAGPSRSVVPWRNGGLGRARTEGGFKHRSTCGAVACMARCGIDDRVRRGPSALRDGLPDDDGLSVPRGLGVRVSSSQRPRLAFPRAVRAATVRCAVPQPLCAVGSLHARACAGRRHQAGNRDPARPDADRPDDALLGVAEVTPLRPLGLGTCLGCSRALGLRELPGGDWPVRRVSWACTPRDRPTHAGAAGLARHFPAGLVFQSRFSASLCPWRNAVGRVCDGGPRRQSQGTDRPRGRIRERLAGLQCFLG